MHLTLHREPVRVTLVTDCIELNRHQEGRASMVEKVNRHRIGHVAKVIGINPQTIRVWEWRGALPAPKRDKRGYRWYTDEDIKMILEHYYYPQAS